ncbi:DUF397 domain-containing protein [Streptomyces sp. HC307]|uniref:DUF397 domain-containing protein n=1 Tax=Streptomyces flavusporus TaxID=3385496 RepID=UPI0039173B11
MGASPVWHKSTYSGATDDDCVEVARTRTRVLVRDSKRPAGPVLRLSFSAWEHFLAHISRAAAQRAA